MTALLVGVFGAAGALLRFAVDTWVTRLQAARSEPQKHWPWATLLVNVAGSFVIGLAAGNLPADPAGPWRLAAAAGLAGGLTTFSSFAVATITLWTERRRGAAVVNLAANLVLGAAAAVLGLAAAG